MALKAVLDWWREAGVDHAFAAEPRAWLAEPAAAEPSDLSPPQAAASVPPAYAPPVFAPAGPEPGARITGLAALPGNLADFRAWWLSEPSLDDGHVTNRVPPRGGEGAALMVLVDHPEAEDRDRLLSGPQGRLLDAMLAAMGLPGDAAYVAACLPRHMPLPDWTALEAAGLGEVVRHHIALARPQRLLVFGRHILPLLGNDPTKSAEPLRRFNHEGGTIPLLSAAALAVLAGKPRQKAMLWQTWLDWTQQGPA
jgi:DNA polymerase